MNTAHQRRSSLASDGRRLKVRVADVRGRFTRWRRWFFLGLIAFYALAPLVRVGGHPLIFLDILHRRFYLFGQTFNAQDAYLLFFIAAIAFLSLILVTSLVGRVWCGWACPQTVYLEGIFRPIERWIEGPRPKQIQLEQAAWNWRKLRIIAFKHAFYIGLALLISNVFISYFVSIEQLRHWVLGSPREHWIAFVWMGCIAGAIYFNFGWFREQTCLIVCPYGKLQSALTDDDSVIIGYDSGRGEPRGRKDTPGAGACVDCLRCVEVCPTGIDIREGLQLECVGCANCVDACDEVMASLKRPQGLVRYDSLRGLSGAERRWLRPRIWVYGGVLLAFMLLAGWQLRARRPFEALLMRQTSAPYVIEAGTIRNQYVLHVFNKTPRVGFFEVKMQVPDGAQVFVPTAAFEMLSLEDRRVPVIVSMPIAAYTGGFDVVSAVKEQGSGREVLSRLRFTGP